MKPIPRRLLIHSVVWASNPQGDGWGGRKGTPVNVEHVRVEPSSKLAQTPENEKVTLSAVLIYDGTNSTPKGLDWTAALRTEVTFNGRKYTVVEAAPFYDARRLHHWEMGLL